MAEIGIATGIITLTEKSLALYRAITAAKNFGSDAAQSVMMLRFEAFRYQEWSQENQNVVAIFAEPSASQSPFVQNSRFAGLFGTKQLISPVATYRETLCDCVTQIIEILQCIDKLLTKYNRAFETREKPGGNSAIGGVASIMVGPGSVQTQMQSSAKKYGHLKDALQSKTSFTRRVKYGIQTWDDADKDVLKDLVQRFKYWNDGIHSIAPPRKLYLQELRMASQVVGSASSPVQLEGVREAAAESNYESVSRSAALKRDIYEAMGDPELKKNYEDVKFDSRVSRSRRFLTDYCPRGDLGPPSLTQAAMQRVIVEWYYYDTKWNDEQALLADERVERLAHQFSFSKKPASLPVQHCIGWIQHPTKRDRALLYTIPNSPGRVSQTYQPVTLNELLGGDRTLTSKRLPTLGERFQLAAALAVGFLELHTVGWIHKGFGSHNLLLFSDPDGKIHYDKPVISGFDFARPDRPGEVSLSTRASKFDIYRHPELRRLKPSPDAAMPSSSRAHDVYSLGLVLFEIGMWMPLESYTKAALRPEDFRKRVEQYVARDLGLWMGNRFRDAVQLCLSGEYLEKSEAFSLGEIEDHIDDQEEPESEETLDQDLARVRQLGYFYQFVVAEIHGCQCEMVER